MDLIIVGNGFDLAHEMPTSYNDFKTFLLCSNPAMIEELESLYTLKDKS